MFSFTDRLTAGAVLPPTSSRSPIELDLSCQDDTKEHFEKSNFLQKLTLILISILSLIQLGQKLT